MTRLAAFTLLALPALAPAQVGEQAGVDRSYGRPYAFAEREPRTDLERTIDRLVPSIVKIHGASGLSTILAYASGVVVSAEGHILTLDLVMMQPGQTRVVLPDGTVRHAELLPGDGELGIRCLKIDPAGLDRPLVPVWPAAREPRNGTFAVSLGNAFRLAEFSEKVSATFGVVVGRAETGLRYRLSEVDHAGELLLTDAPNNPGHVGGGLFTLDGEWIGLNARIVESTETNSVISAAIPAPALLPYLERQVRGERSTGPAAAAPEPVFHGIVLFDSGGRRSPPAYVDRVLRDSPAARAGLRPDDLIVRLDRFAIRTCEEFHAAMERSRPGQTVELTLQRGAAVRRVSVLLEKAR